MASSNRRAVSCVCEAHACSARALQEFPPPFLFTIKYFHKYFTVESTPLIFTQSDTFYEYCDLKNVANFRLRIFTGIRFVLRKKFTLKQKSQQPIIGEEPSRWWTRMFFIKWAVRLDYIAFYIRFLLRTKTRLFDVDDARVNVGHYFCMSSV